MLRFISSLFTTSVKLPSEIDDVLINAAADRVVDGTDIRLRGFGNYRKQLRGSVETSLKHVISMINALPEPVEISRRSYSADTRLQAFFTSTSDLQEKVGGARGVADCLKQADDESSGRIYGVLTMGWGETSRLGTVLQGDTIQREVLQLSVNFFKHQYLEPSVSQEESRMNLKRRLFDYLVERALEKIINERSKRAELEVQRTLLNRKLAAMKTGNWGLEQMLSQDEKLHIDLHSLNSEIESVESELISLGASHEVLQRNMQIIKETLSNTEVILGLHNISITLDNMNMKVADTSSARANTLDLIELYDDRGEKRIIMPGWYPANELPVRNRFSKSGAW